MTNEQTIAAIMDAVLDYGTAWRVRDAMAAYTTSPPESLVYYRFKSSKDDAALGVLLLDDGGVEWLHGDDAAWKGGGPVGTLFGQMIAPPK